jgi:hypothetical protein
VRLEESCGGEDVSLFLFGYLVDGEGRGGGGGVIEAEAERGGGAAVLGVKQHTLGAMIGREDSSDLPILPYEGYRDFSQTRSRKGSGFDFRKRTCISSCVRE